MALFRMLAAAVLVTALVLPATAGAAKHHRPAVAAKARSPIDAATAVALRYWGAAPCQGKVKIIAKQRLSAGVDSRADAWVTFDSALGANNLAAPASSYTNCVIAFADWRWPGRESMNADWDMFCMTMTHEIGHLLGHPHDSTPGSIMAPVFSDYSSEPALCRTTRPRRHKRARASSPAGRLRPANNTQPAHRPPVASTSATGAGAAVEPGRVTFSQARLPSPLTAVTGLCAFMDTGSPRAAKALSLVATETPPP